MKFFSMSVLNCSYSHEEIMDVSFLFYIGNHVIFVVV